MLYLPAGSSRLHRIHGPLVSEEEIAALCDFWRAQAKAVYNEELLKPPQDENAGQRLKASGGGEEVDDELYQEAVRVVCEMGRASTSTLQRRLRIGYGRAARLIDSWKKTASSARRTARKSARSAEEKRLDARVRRIGEMICPAFTCIFSGTGVALR